MQCGIPVLRIECPEAQIFASTPNNKSVWKVCVHNKTDTNKTNRAIIYDSSVCGYEHFVCIDDLRIWAFVKNKKQQVQIGEIICH